MSLGIVFLSEVFGTAMLTLLGCGVVANVALKGTKGNNGGFLMVTWGWGIAVFSGVYVAAMSGAHLNPAVTFGLLLNGKTEYAPGVPVDASPPSPTSAVNCSAPSSVPWSCGWPTSSTSTPKPEPASKLAVFSTGPAIRSTPWNLVTEIIGTFVLVFVILTFGGTPSGSARSPWRCSLSVSASPSVAPPATPSTRPVTSARASPTPCCPSRARAPATGATPGFPSSARWSAASSPASSPQCVPIIATAAA